MNDKQADAIVKRLDILIRLTSLSALRDTKKQKDQIAMLGGAGLPAKEIADLLGTTAATVRKTFSRSRMKPVKEEETNGEAQEEGTT